METTNFDLIPSPSQRQLASANYRPTSGASSHTLVAPSVGELMERLRQIDENRKDIVALASDVTIQENGVTFGGNSLHFEDDDVLRTLSNAVGAPADYLLHKVPADVRTAALNSHVGQHDLGRMVGAATRNGKVSRLFRADLVHLSSAEVMTAALQGIGTDVHSLSVAKVSLSFSRFEVELVTPRKTIEVRKGDIVNGGIYLTHYPFGEQATSADGCQYRLLCLNGSIVRECSKSNREGSRTRKLPADRANSREMQLEQIRQMTRRTWAALDLQLETMARSVERTVEVEPALRYWLRQARLSEKSLMTKLLDAWRAEGSEKNAFGLMNSISRVATHDLSLTDRERRILAALAGILALSHRHFCPHCLSPLR